MKTTSTVSGRNTIAVRKAKKKKKKETRDFIVTLVRLNCIEEYAIEGYTHAIRKLNAVCRHNRWPLLTSNELNFLRIKIKGLSQ